MPIAALTDAVGSLFARRGRAPGGPDFFCVGLQKGGTQWLYDQLQHHPDFWMPPYKELHYFDRDFPDDKIGPAARRFLKRPKRVAARRATRGHRDVDDRDRAFYERVAAFNAPQNDLDAYAALFQPKGALISGDITPGYCTLPGATVKRIAERFGDAKAVLMLRDPVSRLWSQWRMRCGSNGETAERLLDYDAFESFSKRESVRLRSFPSRIATEWSRCFGDRFRVFFLDDVIDRPDETRAGLLEFLGGDPAVPPALGPDFNRKAKDASPERTAAISALMKRLFETERAACATLFGGPAERWPDAPY